MLFTLLAVTLLGTVGNNVVNVPLRELSADLGVPLSSGVLAVSSFPLVLAATMPLLGWVGDRFGRGRTLVAAELLLAGAMIGAALAPNLPTLAAFRGLQGLACAAAPPCVMGMLATHYGPNRRNRMMGAWAAANGIGQALGPPLGGLVAEPWGWRAVFWLLAPLALLLVLALVTLVPAEQGRRSGLHRPGAVAFTAGTATLLAAVVLAPGGSLPPAVLAVLAGAGALALAAFAAMSATARDPLVPARLLTESRFLRSAVAACAQMFCLGATLVAMPLYLTGRHAMPTASAGLVVFALPATMASLAAVVGLLCERTRPRRVLRAGLLTLAAAQLAMGLHATAWGGQLAVLVALLVVTGCGVALVQTPAAAGASRSAAAGPAAAGGAGATLGLFNTLRFGGAALGAAWVGLAYPWGEPLLLFGGCAVLALIALAVSFAGKAPAG
ncbi:MFS family permease [Saccharomonospora amisosensis]|uniref:MFS family permease n=1 Tax=Saccharomonospora amisosensis TaxID=1128677 RepID=A0A7X5URC2_9PSEU|nr:MFS transporter [Saccharomonospora amisosensis]NIJ12343.1 MFS family permease [Saccharomonospora amisosensis]